MAKTDSAFLKEEKHLEMDKKAILGEMNDKNKEVQNLEHEIKTNPGGTAENIQVIKRLRAKRDKLNSDIKNYIKWSLCPYFGRLDFKDDSESDEETIYIGKDHIEVNDKVIAKAKLSFSPLESSKGLLSRYSIGKFTILRESSTLLFIVLTL